MNLRDFDLKFQLKNKSSDFGKGAFAAPGW